MGPTAAILDQFGPAGPPILTPFPSLDEGQSGVSPGGGPVLLPSSALTSGPPPVASTRIESWRRDGAPIPMAFVPAASPGLPRNLFRSSLEEDEMASRISSWLANGCVSTWSDYLRSRPSLTLENHIHCNGRWTSYALSPTRPHTLSPMFFVPKKPTGLRDILNLKEFNRCVIPLPFKNESLDSFAGELQTGDLLWSVDLKDAYWRVKIHWAYRPFLGFHFRSQFFVWNVLPFGLASAPWTFVKMLAPSVAKMRSSGVRLNVYMDDLAVRNSSMEQALRHVSVVCGILEEDGWAVNPKKSVLTPSFTLQHLGFVLSTDPSQPFPTVSLPKDKRKSLRSLCRLALRKADSIPARLLASVIGSCRAASLAMPHSTLALRSVYSDLRSKRDWECSVHLSQEARQDLDWLISAFKTWNGQRTLYPSPEFLLTTDASELGWGGWLSLPSSPDIPLHQAAGFFTPRLAKQSSNFREMNAVLFSLLAFAPLLENKSLKLRTDNSTTMSYVNRYGGSVPHLSRIATKIHSFLLQHRCYLVASHIAGVENVLADSLSRRTDRAEQDWSLHPEVFQELETLFGPHHYDRFASALNSQLPLFNSRYWDIGTAGVDAMNQSWQGMNNYMNPPFSMISQVLRKVREERATVTLVVPVWRGRPWWPQLMEMVTSVYVLPQRPDLFRRGQAPLSQKFSTPSWQVVACRILNGGF